MSERAARQSLEARLRETIETSLKSSMESNIETSMQLAIDAMKKTVMSDCYALIAEEVDARLGNTSQRATSFAPITEEDEDEEKAEQENLEPKQSRELRLDMTTPAVKRLTNDRLRALLEAAKQDTSGTKTTLVRRVLASYQTADQR